MSLVDLGMYSTSSASNKFPHTRAFLTALSREYAKPSTTTSNGALTAKSTSDTSDSEAESEHVHRTMTADASFGGINDLNNGNPAGMEESSDSLVSKVIQLLDAEDDEGVKRLLRMTFDISDEPTLEQSVLELMHKRRDDQANVPFMFLTPVKRPSRPTSRASYHRSSRPATPVFAPSSPLAQGFRRPSTPLTGSVSYTGAPTTSSPSSSPVPASAIPNVSGSPSSSPRFLNAKATEFRPSMVRSMSSSSIARGMAANNPSPAAADLWAHNYAPSPTLSNSSLGIGRGSSNLAIAAPLLPDHSYTPSGSTLDLLDDRASGGNRTPPILIRHNGTENSHTQQRQSTLKAFVDDEEDEDDDPFSPFVVKPHLAPLPPLLRNVSSRSHLGQHPPIGPVPPKRASSSIGDEWSDNSSPSNSFDAPPPLPSGLGVGIDDFYSGLGSPGATPNLDKHTNRPGYFPRTDSNSSLSARAPSYTPPPHHITHHRDSLGGDPGVSDVVFAEQDMTPFEVLSSVFGSSVSANLLQEALEQSGYDFDGAMAWLVDQALPPPPPGLLQHGSLGGMLGANGNVIVVGGRGDSQAARLGNNPNGRNRFVSQPQHSGMVGVGGPAHNGNGKAHAGNRVCRYFLQGECRRADCRFSHDIDRALCRFWLRGQCAKGDNCEFLHSLPQHIDVAGLSNAMNRADLNEQDPHLRNHHDQRTSDFPTLSQADARHPRRNGPDPTRSRWVNAVKKAPQPQPFGGPGTLTRSNTEESIHTTTAGPRASPRIRLRAPSLLPTLPTGETINKLYMAYRAQALELGAARNACLTKAAESWRRGDGAGAKRHSREAHDLNTKMGLETGKAAARLVRERARVVGDAVRSRDPSWSDDPRDRSEKGRMCGGGLGVSLGVASLSVNGAASSTEERTECLLDLHGLHSSEAIEVTEDFLVALELEHYFGLAYLLIGQEKHTGTQDTARGASRARLAAGVRDWLIKWGYPWLERDGVICVDPLTHSQ